MKLFGGHARYFNCQLIWNRLMTIPAPLREAWPSAFARSPRRNGPPSYGT